MATITDGMIFIVLSQIGVYFVLYNHKVRLWRFIGCFAMILVGLSAVMVEDTVPAFVFAGISIIIAFVQFVRDLTIMVSN